jgi:hypothetical protein
MITDIHKEHKDAQSLDATIKWQYQDSVSGRWLAALHPSWTPTINYREEQSQASIEAAIFVAENCPSIVTRRFDMARIVQDENGENKAVSCFLSHYRIDKPILLSAMVQHMTKAGWGAANPYWTYLDTTTHLSERGAQLWLR